MRKRIQNTHGAARLYRSIRKAKVACDGGVALHRLPFTSRHADLLPEADRRCVENLAFDIYLFLPEGAGRLDRVLVVVNGLNDSSYRKFFPWGTALSAAGLATVLFPSAFLMNRRPRAWISPTATQAAFLARAGLASGTSTPINAVLSARLSESPRSLFYEARQTALDLQDVVAGLTSGNIVLSDGARPFEPGTRVDLLGYSLGGYTALGLLLSGGLPADTRVLSFCAGAGAIGPDGLRANPVSPYILDAEAAAIGVGELARLVTEGGALDPLSRTLVDLLAGGSETLHPRVAAAGARLRIFAAQGDRVVPVNGIRHNLGRVDRVFDTGVHEYPFNLGRLDDPAAARLVADAYHVAPAYLDVFDAFIDAVLAALEGPLQAPRRPSRVTCASHH